MMLGTSYIVPVKREDEKNLSFVKTVTYDIIPILEIPIRLNRIADSYLHSTILSPMANSESKRYHYPVCHTSVATHHPLSRFQSSARGPGLSLTRSL